MERPNAAASFSVLLRLIGPSEAKGREESRKPRGACPPCLEFGHRKRIGKNGFTRRGRAIHQIPGDWSVFLEAFAMAFDNLTQRGKNSCVVLRFRPGKSGLWVQKITFWHRSLLVEVEPPFLPPIPLGFPPRCSAKPHLFFLLEEVCLLIV